MESFFFNITDTRYKVTPLLDSSLGSVERVDISNGIVFVAGELRDASYTLSLENLDRMVMLLLVKEGEIDIEDHIGAEHVGLAQGETAICVSSRQQMEIVSRGTPQAKFFMLFVADFFLKRYLSGNRYEPIDLLYTKMQEEVSLEQISTLRVDALSLYLIEKLSDVRRHDRMQSIRAEHRIVEFMIHRFGLLDIAQEALSEEEERLAGRAKEILLAEFVSPPTIEVLAHRCATNASKLKKVFKKVYNTTLYGYVQHLRMEEANLLLRSESLPIKEIAKRVGYRHQGHFSKRFFETFGVYPKALRQSTA